ncbi:MAG: hypothetical protein GXC76_04100 [Rhodanobacteraceae bacterium]|jgi:hypothetical protein|nr:hypothetical protein [Rhodanobacteraceae bacterium]
MLGLLLCAQAMALDLCGNTTTTGVGQTYGEVVKLTCPTSLVDTGGGAITFASAVTGPAPLEVSTSGLIQFGAQVDLSSLTTTSGNVVLLGPMAIAGPLSVTTATGDIAPLAGLSVAGPASFVAGNGAIDLSRMDNTFLGPLRLVGTSATVGNSAATILGQGAISGSLLVIGSGGISQSGAVSVTGAARFNPIGGPHDIDLSDPGNAFTGGVYIEAAELGHLRLANGASATGTLTPHAPLVVSLRGSFLVQVDGAMSVTTGDDLLLLLDSMTIVRDSVALASEGTLTIHAGLLLSDGTVSMEAGDGLVLNSLVQSSGDILLGAQGPLNLGGTLQAANVKIAASAGQGNTLTGSISTSGKTTLQRGDLELADTATTGDVRVDAGTNLRGIGDIGAVSNAGTVSPGTASEPWGSLRAASLDMAGGILAVAAAQSGQASRLAVAGEAHLGGTLRVDFGGASPLLGTTYTVLTAAGITGAFDDLSLAGSLAGTRFDAVIEQDGKSVTLAIVGLEVSGTVSGVASEGLALRLNGGHDVAISGNGRFAFPARLAWGSSYVASVAAQPAGQHCTIAHAVGVVAGPVDDIEITCTTPAPQLVLTVDDAVDYARYGQVLDYVVTLTNTGDGIATGIDLFDTWSMSLDSTQARWWCFGDDGAPCDRASGTGPLTATGLGLAPGRSRSWLVSISVLAGATDPFARYEVTVAAPQGVAASDTDTLVLFRDGFGQEADVDFAGTAPGGVVEWPDHAVELGLDLGGGASRGRIETAWIVDAGHGDRLLVQRLIVGAASHVRLLLRARDGSEAAGAWSAAMAPQLSLSWVEVDGDAPHIVLHGTRESLAMPLAVEP